MLQVRVHGPGDVRLDDVDEPAVGPGDAVVAITACGLCGSDQSYVRTGGLGSALPMALGHEMAGVVEAVGTGVTQVRVGDHVVVRPGIGELPRIGNGADEGGLTPLLLVRHADRRLYPIPEGLDLEVAALAEPLGIGMNAVNQAEAGADDKVVVLGCGPVGLGAVAALVDRGNEQVVTVDLSARRRQLALDLGAHAVVDPATGDLWAQLEALHGTVPTMVGPKLATDAYIEASGATALLPELLGHARDRARVSIVALHFQDVPINFIPVTIKELTIRGAVEYPDRFEDMIDLLARRDLSALITHRYPLDQFHDALAMAGSADCGKVLVLP